MAGPRQTNPTRFELIPGIYTEDTESGALRRWKDGDMIRFTSKMPEKIGGSLVQTLSFDDGTSTEIMGHVRAILDWTTFDGTRLVAIGTECKLYLIQDLTVYDITPIRQQSNATNPFTTTTGSALVLVTDVSFGGNLYDHVRFRDATAVGGITITGEYQIVDIVDADHYYIEHTSAASSSASGGGSVVIQYDISCGLEDDGTILTGYGTGLYGMEDYGNSMDETSTYAGTARLWSLDNFGEDLLASPRGESLFWWDRSNGAQSRATRVTQAPESIQRFLMSPNEKFAIALGCTEITTGNEDKMLIRWCDLDDFTNWTPALLASDESFAGFRRPKAGSYLITGIRTETLIMVWSDIAMYRMLYVGEPNIFEVEQVGEQVRIMGPNCVVEVDGTIFFMGRDNFFVYDGGKPVPIPCDIWTYVFEDVNRSQASKFYAWVNTAFSEVWFHYAREGSNENDRVAIFNYEQKVWYYNTLARESGHPLGAFDYPYAFLGGSLYLHENGVNDGFDDVALTSFIESFFAEIEQGAYNMLVHDYEPDMRDLEGTLNLTLTAKERPNSIDTTQVGPAEDPALAMDLLTEIVHPRIRGGLLSLRMESDQVDDFWRAGTPRIRSGAYGRR
jgi:hypothetical protein